MSQAGKGHVPEENLHEYRKYARLARQFDTLGNSLSNMSGYGERSREMFALCDHFWHKANDLRADLDS